jgi:hypothetical protein
MIIIIITADLIRFYPFWISVRIAAYVIDLEQTISD